MDPSPALADVRSAFSPRDVVLFLLLSASWGLSFLFIKIAVGEISPLWIVAIRTTIGGVVLAVILRLRGTRLPRDRRQLLHLLVLAIASNAVPWGAVAWAQQFLPSGLTAVVNSLVPAATLAVAAAAGVERLTVRKIAGLTLAMGGTLIVLAGELGTPDRAVALLVVIGATGLYGGGAVYAKRYVSGRLPPLAVATGQVGLAAVVTLPAAFLLSAEPAWSQLTGGAVVAVTALGVFGTGLAFLLFYALIENVGPTNATMVTYVIPVIGLVAGWLVLDERFGLNVVAGAAVLIAGIWLAQRERALAPPAGEAAALEPGPQPEGADQTAGTTRNVSA